MSTRPLRADAQRNRTRILDAASTVFATQGVDASTEEVARAAGVAIGTIFRHFPTKADLVRALMKRLLDQITSDAETLAAQDDPAALFDFFTRLVELTATNRAVVTLLAPDLSVAGPLGTLSSTLNRLLVRGQKAGAIRKSVRLDEVMALLVSTCQGTLHGAWDADLRHRTLSIIFTGLRP